MTYRGFHFIAPALALFTGSAAFAAWLTGGDAVTATFVR